MPAMLRQLRIDYPESIHYAMCRGDRHDFLQALPGREKKKADSQMHAQRC